MAAAGREASPKPSPAGSPAALEAEPASEPLPVADYWGAWSLHKKASRGRLQAAIDNARNARSKKLGFYRSLVGGHDDEMKWLANHQPEACYAEAYEQWRTAVEELHALAKRSVGFARKGEASGLKRIVKQRRAATKDLDKVLSRVADCVDSVPPTIVGDPFVGTWISRPVTAGKDGFVDRSVRRLAISDGGRLLLRIPHNAGCREAGFGLVPLTIHGKGEMVAAASPEFHRMGEAAYCHPRSGRKLPDNPGGPIVWDHDAATGVIVNGAECYWRTKSGSPKHCRAFWPGTPPKSERVEAPVGEAAGPGEEATASPDIDEGWRDLEATGIGPG